MKGKIILEGKRKKCVENEKEDNEMKRRTNGGLNRGEERN